MKSPLLVLFLYLFFSNTIDAQTIRGRISSTFGERIEFVNIGIIGKNIGTVSDRLGEFQLTLDKVSDNDSVKISCIAYYPLTLTVKEFKNFHNQVIELDEQIFELAEIKVSPKEYKHKTLGVKTSSKMIQGGFTDNMLGYECGILMKIKKSAILERVNINISTCSFDSILYRLNIYRQTESDDFENILRTPIYIKLPKTSIKETISIDLKPYNIVAEGNALVTVEHIKDLGEGQLLFCAGFINKTYYRKTSQALWETVPIGLSISVEAKVEK